ncbi:MAG: biotin transporter BioY [Oscillospiraceae bacterium]|nr:biotin transporter BioY [Oscillospiraceae bacterium]
MPKVKILALCAMFAALSAVLSQVSLPIGPVPITLTHISVFAAAGLLGAKYGLVSQLIFVSLGVLGLPVFAGFNSGISALIGPTGGFIVGYLVCTFVCGWIIEIFGNSVYSLTLAMYAGWVATYLCGITWYMYYSGTPLTAALSVCLIPFLPGDLAKTAVTVLVVKRLKHKALQQM